MFDILRSLCYGQPTMQSAEAIILAAGKGTRMQSDLPKVLHPLRDKPMLVHVLDALVPLAVPTTVVVGYGAEQVRCVIGTRARAVLQETQRGTGHAVMCALQSRFDSLPDTTLVLLGDMPLVTTASVNRIMHAHASSNATITLGTITAPSFDGHYHAFTSYGRVVRDTEGNLTGIVEVKDASEDVRAVRELNTGIYCFNSAWLAENIQNLSTENKAGEYYLTDTIALAYRQGLPLMTQPLLDVFEALGANTPDELAALSEIADMRDARDRTLAKSAH